MGSADFPRVCERSACHVDMQMSKTTRLVLREDSVVGGEEEPMRRQPGSDIPASERINFFKQPFLFIIYRQSEMQ